MAQYKVYPQAAGAGNSALTEAGRTLEDLRDQARQVYLRLDFQIRCREDLERRMEAALSRVEGAGEVSVVLTLRSGTRQVLAQDISSARAGEEETEERTTVVVSAGSGREEAVALQQIYPQFQGALVVCAGGDDPAVQLKLVEAVSALTGLGSDKISICKGR